MQLPNSHPIRWLRIEGAAVLLFTTALYTVVGSGWLLFLVLFLAPDLTMLGYLRGARVGAVVYNLGHTYTVPLVLATSGMFLNHGMVVSLALIWTAHIGLDRMLGYGLKLPTSFHDTHLGRIGRRSAESPPVQATPASAA